jgi:alkylhydroperoxidase/carboxymuconolactone decarboxylase family protein YurZ
MSVSIILGTWGQTVRRRNFSIGYLMAQSRWRRLARFIDAYTKSCLEEGMSLEHITEAVHVVAAIRGVASFVHAIQAHNAA